MIEIRGTRDVRADKLREVAEAEIADQAERIGAIGATIGDSGDTGYAPAYVRQGELFIAGGVSYVAKCNIAGGEPIREGINATRTSVAEYINSIKEANNG